MTIDPATGHVFIIYYALDVANKNATDVCLTSSSDGGETFRSSKISKSAFLADNFIGDYLSVAAYDRHIYPVWTRSDSKTSTSIWTALVIDSEKSSIVTEQGLGIGLPRIVGGSEPIAVLSLSIDSHVSIEVIDEVGRTCGSRIDADLSAGEQRLSFGRKFPSGPYLARFSFQGKSYCVKFCVTE